MEIVNIASQTTTKRHATLMLHVLITGSQHSLSDESANARSVLLSENKLLYGELSFAHGVPIALNHCVDMASTVRD